MKEASWKRESLGLPTFSFPLTTKVMDQASFIPSSFYYFLPSSLFLSPSPFLVTSLRVSSFHRLQLGVVPKSEVFEKERKIIDSQYSFSSFFRYSGPYNIRAVKKSIKRGGRGEGGGRGCKERERGGARKGKGEHFSFQK